MKTPKQIRGYQIFFLVAFIGILVILAGMVIYKEGVRDGKKISPEEQPEESVKNYDHLKEGDLLIRIKESENGEINIYHQVVFTDGVVDSFRWTKYKPKDNIIDTMQQTETPFKKMGFNN